MRAVVLFASFSLVAVAGCAIDASSNTHGTPCGASGACATGSHCYRGFCVSDGTGPDMGHDDGGPGSPDTGMDAGTDGGNDAALDGGDWCDGAMAACTTGLPGACSAGHTVCGMAGATCAPDHAPTAETCGSGPDGDDEDCDGITDEESAVRCYPTTAMGCTDNHDGTFTCTGACRPGTQTCGTSGSLGPCTGPVTPPTTGEVCQNASQPGVDENCNGEVDETCTCTGTGSRACYTGDPAQAGIGECRLGMQTCNGSTWGPCTGSVLPMPETCMNGNHDDDCDGNLDNIPGRGAACMLPGMGDCAQGVMDCMGSGLACQGPSAHPEVCDHHDDDCDGAVDEAFHFASDDMNCGDCGNVCGTGTHCCNGVCRDESTDGMNCGGCAVACSDTPGADHCCGAMCLDTDHDEMNCGACGNVCNAGQQCCGGNCVDPQNDEMNCGACADETGGVICNPSDTSASTCCGGTCRSATAPQCTGCAVDCTMQVPPTTCCSNSCVDRMTDEANCGTCGHACTAGQICCGGSCVGSDATHCGGSCTVCTGSQLCCSNACVPNDTRHCQACGTACATGNACCADGCRDLTVDSNDCGACGMACTGGTHCTNSHCCGAGLTYCGSACVNTNTDRNNCGTCGHTCALGCNGSGACNLF